MKIFKKEKLGNTRIIHFFGFKYQYERPSPGCLELDENTITKLKYMATTGEGSDKCLNEGFLLVPVHFYQPIPNLKELEQRKVWDKVTKLDGIKFDDEVFTTNLNTLAKYSSECSWCEGKPSNKHDFYVGNSYFSYGCATALHGMIREHKPKRIIEVGSGHSSKIIRDALQLNEKEGHSYEKYTIIDPYSSINPSDFVKKLELIKKPVETIDIEMFKELKENDILFIDSSHVCKIGSDVNFEILELLPILNKNVHIHFHDIDLPYEYGKGYAMNSRPRLFWTESYLLQAFLAFNKDFEIYLPMAYIQNKHADLHKSLFPKGADYGHWYSNSFWIKRINKD